MQRWKNIAFNSILCLNCLLLLFVLAGNALRVPAWLQVAGRMHPLFLHFPIVLLLLYIVWSIFLQAKVKQHLAGSREDEIGQWLLLLSAGTAALTALMGFFLSREEGYNQQALAWHKWGGVAVSLFAFAWYAYRDAIHRKRYMPQLAAMLSFVLILFTGHQGSNITHGENYLLAPVSPGKTRPAVSPDKSLVYADLVQPLLETKCMACHNSAKAKGALVMETAAQLQQGGRHGAVWISGHPELSLLMQRILLPETEKKHMPPAGKPQLDDNEKAILYQWIKSGMNFKQKVADLPAGDSLRLLATNLLGQPAAETFDFAAASDKDIQQLNNTNRVVHPIAQGSPALAVDFYNPQNYTTAALKELLALKKQVIWLNMAHMPLQAADLELVAQFTQLRRLNLNFSHLPGKSMAALKKLSRLNNISLAGTTVNAQDLQPLLALPALHALYVWNARIQATDIPALQKKYPRIRFETGFMNDSLLLKLNPPVLETEERIVNGSPLSLKLKHYIKGVTLRYTTDGTTPDSLHSAVYRDSIMLDKAAVFKARAFKPGWLGSDSIAAAFYKNTYHADSIRSLTPLDSVYKGSLGARTLINGEKGDFAIRNGKWLGFRRNRMEMLLHYAQPVKVASVTISTIIDIRGFIMPPALLEIWGGMEPGRLVRLSRLTPQQPDSIRGAYMKGFDCSFPPVSIRFLKVVAVPVPRLPSWHPGKGQPGWVFTDEIFVN